MAAESFIGRLTKGSRYQAEKIVTIAVYVSICLATIFWVFNTGNVENDLGATATFEKVGPLESPTFFINNDSNDDWNNVRIAVDKQYLYMVPEVPEGETVTLRPEDFSYYFHIPRPWGREAWETLAEGAKPGATAVETMDPRLLEINADEGRFDVDLKAPPKPKK